MYHVLKKITPIMIIITIVIVVGTVVKTRWVWEEADLELVSSLPVQQVEISNKSSIYSISGVNAALDRLEEDESRCCIEIHTEQQWKELVEIWKIDTGNYMLEFPGYYVISLGWEIRGMRYRRVDKEAGKVSYGEIEKGNYQAGMVYIYKCNECTPLSYLAAESHRYFDSEGNMWREVALGAPIKRMI